VKRRQKLHELPGGAEAQDGALLDRVEDMVDDGQHNLQRWV